MMIVGNLMIFIHVTIIIVYCAYVARSNGDTTEGEMRFQLFVFQACYERTNYYLLLLRRININLSGTITEREDAHGGWVANGLPPK